MIETYLVSKLGTIEQLQGQIYPTAAPVGDLAPPFCIYTRVSGDVERDLAGEPVFYRDVFRLDLCGEDNDALVELETEIIADLTENGVESGELYIFSAFAAPGSPDGFDLTMETHRRSVAYAVTYWR